MNISVKSLLLSLLVFLGAVIFAPTSYALSMDDDITSIEEYIYAPADDNVRYPDGLGFPTTSNSRYLCYFVQSGSYTYFYYNIFYDTGLTDGGTVTLTSSGANVVYSFNKYIGGRTTLRIGQDPTNKVDYLYNSNANPLQLTFGGSIKSIYTNLKHIDRSNLADVIPVYTPDVTPDNVSFTDFDNMSTEYLEQKGFQVSTAYFADEHGTAQYTLPIVTSYQDLPVDYDGMFLQDLSTDFCYRYKVGIMPTSDPNDFSQFWDSFVCVTYNVGTFTNGDLLIGSDYELYPSVKLFGTTTYNKSLPYQLENGLRLRGVTVPFQTATNSTITFGAQWRYQDVSAIPRTVISDLYFAFNYHNYVDDGQGGTIDEGGSDSDEYNNYVQNLIYQLQQQLYQSLNGTDYGASSFSADWSGDTLTATAPYENDFQFSDDTGKSLFTTLFSMGGGFVLTAAIGTLSIALAAYVLFGKS